MNFYTSVDLRRNFVGCELNPDYAKLAEARIAEEVPNTLEGALQ